MTHTYKISGMTCQGCKNSVQNALGNLAEIQKVTANLEKEEVQIEMYSHLSVEKLQETLLKAGLHYTIGLPNAMEHSNHSMPAPSPKKAGNGVYYCPMHCEGEKTYDEQGDCPVCGMHLVEQPQLVSASKYTCPMHPEIIKEVSGACPICGMDLVPITPTESAEDKTYQDLLKKMKIAALFTIPIFILAMADMVPGNPFTQYRKDGCATTRLSRLSSRFFT